MRLLPAYYPIQDRVQQVLPFLSTSHTRQLSLWVAGVIEAKNGCEAAVVLALEEAAAQAGQPVAANTIRQDLRELFRDAETASQWPNRDLDLQRCFPALLAYVLALLQTDELALAIDVTHFQDDLAAIVVSVVYRACAIPVAWTIRGAATPGRWMPLILALLTRLRPVVPERLRVLVLADEGLFSPALLRTVRDWGWVPVLRSHLTTEVTLAASGRQCQASVLVARPGQAWVGRVVLFKTAAAHLRVTLLVLWGVGHEEAWVVVTSAAPREVGLWWYSLRAWIECGFRVLKSMGWEWERTQRRLPMRVAWHWLVLTLATIIALAAGTRAEEAGRQGVPRDRVTRPMLPPPPATGHRAVSVFTRGCEISHRQLVCGQLLRHDWLLQERWPEPPPDLTVRYADDLSTSLPQ